MPRASKRRPTSPGPPPSVTGAGDVLAGSHMHSCSVKRACAISASTLPADCGGMYSPTLASLRFPTGGVIYPYSSRSHASQKPHIGLAYRTGNHLSLRRPTVLQYQVRRPLGACQTGVDQEALRAYPLSGQVEVVQARHSGARSAGEAAFSGGWERANGLDSRQVLAPDQHTAPARLRRVEQVFEIALVLTRVPRIPWVQLLEGDDQGRSFGGDARVDGLGTYEPRTVQILHHRTIWDRQTLEGHVETGDARRDQAFHNLAHDWVLSPIH